MTTPFAGRVLTITQATTEDGDGCRIRNLKSQPI
jgi:hypothetical protein